MLSGSIVPWIPYPVFVADSPTPSSPIQNFPIGFLGSLPSNFSPVRGVTHGGVTLLSPLLTLLAPRRVPPLQPHPELPDRVLGIAPLELLAGPRVHPRRAHLLSPLLDHVAPRRRAPVLAQPHAERPHVHPLLGRVARPHPQVQPERRLGHH